MKFLQDGTPVCNFSVATTSTLSKATHPQCSQGWQESYNGRGWELVVWWRVTAWRGLAETVNSYLSKGRQVYDEGEIAGETANGVLNPRVWAGQGGMAKASFEVAARSVTFLGGRDDGLQQGDSMDAYSGRSEPDEALPF